MTIKAQTKNVLLCVAVLQAAAEEEEEPAEGRRSKRSRKDAPKAKAAKQAKQKQAKQKAAAAASAASSAAASGDDAAAAAAARATRATAVRNKQPCFLSFPIITNDGLSRQPRDRRKGKHSQSRKHSKKDRFFVGG